MSFQIFDFSDKILEIIGNKEYDAYNKLERIMQDLGEDCAPKYLLEFIRHFSPKNIQSIAFHPCASIEGFKDANHESIVRLRGFMGRRDMEFDKFPDAVHHLKVFYNAQNRARLFYKYAEKISFIKNCISYKK